MPEIIPPDAKAIPLSEAISRTGIPPDLRVTMDLDPSQPNMDAPVYRVEKKWLDRLSVAIGIINMSGITLHTSEDMLKYERCATKEALMCLGIYETTKDMLMVVSSPTDPRNIIHEATHIRGGELQKTTPKLPRNDHLGELVAWALSNSELEAMVNSAILSKYIRPSFTPNEKYDLSIYGFHTIIHKNVNRFSNYVGLHKAATHRKKIIDAIKWDIIHSLFRDHTRTYGTYEDHLAIVDACTDVLSDDHLDAMRSIANHARTLAG